MTPAEQEAVILLLQEAQPSEVLRGCDVYVSGELPPEVVSAAAKCGAVLVIEPADKVLYRSLKAERSRGWMSKKEWKQLEEKYSPL